jgi:hypothetical protein
MSTEFKHTPGPWEIYRIFSDPIKNFHDRHEHLSHDIVTSDHVIIGSVIYMSNTNMAEVGVPRVSNRLEMEANAKIIAAAPEMLEALIDAYMVLYGGNSASIQEALARVPFNTTPLDFKMMVAIKKATGQ